MDVLAALIPPVAMLAVFVAIAVTAYRSTDGARRRERESRADAQGPPWTSAGRGPSDPPAAADGNGPDTDPRPGHNESTPQ